MRILVLSLHVWYLVGAMGRMKFKLCEYASRAKYIGYYNFTTGKADIQPFESSTISSKENCNKNCKINDQCYATSYDLENNCSFYNTSDFVVSIENGKQYSRWLPCNMSDGDKPQGGRCPGLWVSYNDFFLSANEYQILGTSFIRRIDCREQCLQNPLCGFIDYRDPLCILIPKWPYLNLNMMITKTWTVDNWTCVDHYVDNLEIQKEESQPNKEKCTGYWTISNKNYSLKSSETKYLNFQTQIYTDCLEECNRQSNCFKAFYNVTYSLCVLYQIERSDGIPFPHNILVIVFDWICVKNDSHRPVMNEDEKRYLGMGMNCYRIISTEDLYIGRDECGRYPSISRFVKCTEFSREYEWDITDSCLVNQSYWAFPTGTILLGNMSGHEMWNVTKVFTGLQIYWLAHLGGENLLNVDYLECRSFNASRPIEVLKSNEVIKRNEYQALTQNGTTSKFSMRPTKFAISATGPPFHSCKTKAACTDILRWLQIYYFHGDDYTDHYVDIPFNFMIDEEGNIYEGRGWKNQCAAVATYNPETICVAYIGYFRDNLPGERFLNSLKKLIEYAMDHGYIIKDYGLFIQQDLGRTSIQRNFAIVIKNWYRYRGFLPEDCTNISALVLSLNIVAFLIATILLLRLIYTMFTFKKRCPKCQFISEGKLELRQLIPVNRDSNVPQLSTVTNESRYSFIIYERSKCIGESRYLQTIKLILKWFSNRYLDRTNANVTQNSFQNYLSSFPYITNSVLVFETELLINENAKPVRSRVIICVPYASTMTFLKGLIQNGSCICYYFRSEFINVTPVSMLVNHLGQ